MKYRYILAWLFIAFVFAALMRSMCARAEDGFSHNEKIEMCSKLEVDFHYFVWNHPDQFDWNTFQLEGAAYACEDHNLDSKLQDELCFQWWNFECEFETFSPKK